MKKCFYIGMMVCFMLSACTYRTNYRQSGAKEYAPTNSTSIKIYSGIPENMQYEVLGSVCVNAISKGKAVRAVKEEAAKLGANAIINVKLDLITSSYLKSRIGISGVAVKVK